MSKDCGSHGTFNLMNTLEADADPGFHVFKTRNTTRFGSRHSLGLWLDLEPYFDVVSNIGVHSAVIELASTRDGTTCLTAVSYISADNRIQNWFWIM